MLSCHEKKSVAALSMDSFSDISVDRFSVCAASLNENIRLCVASDTDKLVSDSYVKKYYRDNGRLLWLTRSGVSSKADSVLEYIKQVDGFGFNPERFFHGRIKKDLHTARSLDFDNGDNSVNRVYARLEYYLTKAYMRYCTGQRFGYVNPCHLFNRLDRDDGDTVNVVYKQLFDIPMLHPGDEFYSCAITKVVSDSVGSFLSECRPDNILYKRLVERYRKDMPSKDKVRLLCNLERCRWVLEDYPGRHDKYVIINLPAQNLVAVDKDDRLAMRIGCGAFSTKTPLLTSRIKRIDFNPQWIIPRSIIRTSIVRHVGDTSYFERNNYFVQERKTGSRVGLDIVTRDMLLSPDYLVVQQGGAGNALGSVIFRFDNKFSVFMHDTSSPSVFGRINRSVSHGCIRAEKPFDLAVFMLDDKDDETVEKIKYSMDFYSKKTRDVIGERGSGEKLAYDRKKYLNSLRLANPVPIFITYYTIYPDVDDVLRDYKDIYGYDKVIYEYLRGYI